MTDFDPIDWTEDDHVTDAEVEAALVADNVCIRPVGVLGATCTQGYDHTGPCDWFAEAVARNYTIADVGAHLRHDLVTGDE